MGLEIYFEFQKRGTLVKVTAIEGVTGVEASVVCPQNLNPNNMRNLALRKLMYLLRSKKLLKDAQLNKGSVDGKKYL